MHALLSLSWGFFSDVDIESERWRFLGGARFTVGAIVRVLFMRRYDARIRFSRSAPRTPPTPRFSSKTDPATTTTTRTARLQQVRHQPESKAEKGRRTTSAARTGWVTRTTPGLRSARRRRRRGAPPPASRCPTGRDGAEIAGDDVQGVWALNLPWAAEDMFAAPAAQCSDGAFDLLVFKGHSRLSLLLNLLKLDAGRHVPHSRVTHAKASELEVVPGASSTGQGGYIAVDGELVARAREVNAGGAGRRRRRRRGWGRGNLAVRMVTEVDPELAGALRADEPSGGAGQREGVWVFARWRRGGLINKHRITRFSREDEGDLRLPIFSICVYESPYGFRDWFRDWTGARARPIEGLAGIWMGCVARRRTTHSTPPPTGTIGNKGEKMSEPAAAVEAPAPETPATSVADEPAAEGGAEGQSKKAAKKVRRERSSTHRRLAAPIAARNRREIRRRAAGA